MDWNLLNQGLLTPPWIPMTKESFEDTSDFSAEFTSMPLGSIMQSSTSSSGGVQDNTFSDFFFIDEKVFTDDYLESHNLALPTQVDGSLSDALSNDAR